MVQLGSGVTDEKLLEFLNKVQAYAQNAQNEIDIENIALENIRPRPEIMAKKEGEGYSEKQSALSQMKTAVLKRKVAHRVKFVNAVAALTERAGKIFSSTLQTENL